jgi:protein-S-isoprenylcysteine O-methyltransferase Ste14
MTTSQILLFAAATICLIGFSWVISLRQKRYHGIARFFAFESIALLTILNIKYWFASPLVPKQLLSWLLLAGCIPVAVIGFIMLYRHGKPKGAIEFENTSKLVTVGLYKYIRHPLYCSLAILGIGIFLKHIGTIQIALVIVNTIALYITCLMEEKEMIGRFGDEYRQYMKKSKMFIPFIL